MRKIAIFVLDLIFMFAWLALITIIIVIASSFAHGLSALTAEWELLGGFGKRIFWSTVVSWTALTGLMLLHCYGNTRFDDFKSNLWTRILLIHFFVVGPTVYYIGSFRVAALSKSESSTHFVLKKMRLFIDGLYYLSFWGSISLFASVVATLVFSSSVESFTFLATLSLLLIPLSGIPTIMLMTILLLDAVERPKEHWERINFLRFLNPWAWAFGVRKYYLGVLRPDLLAVVGEGGGSTFDL
ncbi:hypothetical protein MYX65_12715 [Acidobacteria bacterium AH-259-L09]|nr:hypothetical protein [Acidobacteria bacterium AH-259-L09]